MRVEWGEYGLSRNATVRMGYLQVEKLTLISHNTQNLI